MENKYYTPSTEEFFVGFECEWQSKIRQESWNKQICDVDLINIAYDSFEHSDIEEPFNEQFRVKYLDSSDIEELGFKKIIKDQYYYDEWINPITLLIDDDMFVQIINKCNGTEYYLFQGTIKNKSELIRLLGWLNV